MEECETEGKHDRPVERYSQNLLLLECLQEKKKGTLSRENEKNIGLQLMIIVIKDSSAFSVNQVTVTNYQSLKSCTSKCSLSLIHGTENEKYSLM